MSRNPRPFIPKSLRPSSGILARDIPSDQQDLAAQSIAPISIVVCNLYPFTSTIARPGCTLADAVEEIDIGGVTLLRAAAKNHERVSVLSDPADYADFAKAWAEGRGDVGAALRSRLALKAFEMTATYDAAISAYFREQYADAAGGERAAAGPAQRLALRYGANPHQKPAQAFVTEGELPFKGRRLVGPRSTLALPLTWRPPFSFVRRSGLHQPPRCVELIRTCERIAGGFGASGGGVLQACLSRGRSCRLGAE